MNDDEMVEELLRHSPDAGKPSRHPRYSEFSPETEALADVTDRLGEVVRGLVGLGGKKPKPVKATPRPQTAFQRVKEAHDLARHDSVVARLTPPDQRAATEEWELVTRAS